MKNLNELKVINVESDLEYGFFWVEFEGSKSLQCCLVAAHHPEDGYLEQVHIWNNGYNDGICHDVNEWAVIDGDWDHINDYLVNKARENGIQIVA